jgi:purine nucleosidase
MRKLHLDTDLGGDVDDLCALAMALNWPDVELLGITTVAEHGGKRAGYVRYALALAGRADITVAAGADAALNCYRSWPALPPEDRYWPEPIPPAPTSLDEALSAVSRKAHSSSASAPARIWRCWNSARPASCATRSFISWAVTCSRRE